MQHHSRKIICLHAVLVLLLFSSCMPQKHPVSDKTPANGTRREVDRIRMKSEQYMVQRDYKNALDVYADACRKYSDDQVLFTNYNKTRDGIHRAADEAYNREDFASSGLAYYVLLKNYSYCPELFQEPSFDKVLLHNRLDHCSSSLSQRALAEYRKGNLADAISIWKSILAFDPNNTGIMKEIDTATIQLKYLQQKRE
jgi:tetratricopeptide (TPR) repeat protein